MQNEVEKLKEVIVGLEAVSNERETVVAYDFPAIGKTATIVRCGVSHEVYVGDVLIPVTDAKGKHVQMGLLSKAKLFLYLTGHVNGVIRNLRQKLADAEALGDALGREEISKFEV